MKTQSMNNRLILRVVVICMAAGTAYSKIDSSDLAYTSRMLESARQDAATYSTMMPERDKAALAN